MTDHDQTPARRSGESGPVPQRGSRTFEKADGWYFMTREKVDVGPFASQDLAEQGVQHYAGFSMDADKVYLDAVDVVADESGIQWQADDADDLPAEPELPVDVFDRRRGDMEPAPQRNPRIFQRPDGFWFATRDGDPVGPFPTQADAERGIRDFVGFAIDVERVVAMFEGQEDPGATGSGQ